MNIKTTNKNAKNSAIAQDERDQIAEIVSDNKASDLDTVNSYSSMLYQWYFILNSGGLIGTITLLSFKLGKFYIPLCASLLIIFFLGIVSIVAANILEAKWFKKSASKIDENYNLFTTDQITKKELFELMDEDVQSYKWITICEWLSPALFSFGFITGVVYLSFVI